MPTTDPATWQNPGVLVENNTDEPLGASGVYTGEWSNVAYFPSITTAIISDVDGRIDLQFSPDKINIDAHNYFNYRVADLKQMPHRVNVTHKWFRVVYTNDTSPQTYLRIHSIAGYQHADIKINGDDNPNGSLSVKLPTVTDMTNRLRVANLNKILETVWQYDLQPRSWSTRLTGSGTVSGPGQKDPAYAQMATTTASGDKAELRTKRFLVYEPFRTHVVTMAMILGEGKANLVKRFGQYTGFNGWYFEQNGTSEFYVGYRNNSFELTGTIDTRIERANWNIDRLDGTGPSGLNIANLLNNALTFVIEYVWHGTQGIRFEIEYFDKLYPVHEVVWSATEEKPFARSALLPINYEIENTGAVASNTTIYVGPASFNIEGGEERAGLRFSRGNRPTEAVTATSTTVPNYIFGIRPKLQLNSINNRGSITPLSYQVFSDADIYFEIQLQAIPTNGTWTSIDATSITEYSFDFTTFSTVGYTIASGYVQGSNNRSGNIADSFEDLETVGIETLNSNAQLAIVVRAYKMSANANVRASLKWKETY